MLDFIIQAIYPLSWVQIGTAMLCGGLLGLERQARGRPVGVRTSIMICLGCEIFVHLGTTISGPGSDPTRVLGQVITGIGFLGAGVMLGRGNYVMGVTSASVIWIMAAVGAVIGLGYISAAITLTIMTITVLLLFDYLESKLGYAEAGRKSRTPTQTLSD